MRVIVIGAGIIGLAIADALVRRGVSVIVLDMRGPGRGASHASAGILAPYSEAHANSSLLALGERSLALYDTFVSALRETTGRIIPYVRTGTLDVACSTAERAALEARRDWLTRAGVLCEWLDRTALRGFEPAVTPDADAGLWTRVHGFVGVQPLVAALEESARRAGATVVSGVDVHALSLHTSHVAVAAGDTSYQADAVVLAAGSWTTAIAASAGLTLPVRPVRGQLLAMRWRDASPPGRVIWGSSCYVVPWPDGTMLVGATAEDAGFDETPTIVARESLTRSVEALLPAARGATIDAVRVGLRPALPDELPAIGPFAHAPRVIAATGHYRNGILLAPLTAALVTSFLADGVRDEALTHVSPDRFVPD
jgi:glycine oxidase